MKSTMTDEDARTILRGTRYAYIEWNDESNRPDWCEEDESYTCITLDGEFTALQLRAILHFAPKEGL
jgi:hypothetical protein